MRAEGFEVTWGRRGVVSTYEHAFIKLLSSCGVGATPLATLRHRNVATFKSELTARAWFSAFFLLSPAEQNLPELFRENSCGISLIIKRTFSRYT